MPYVNRLTCFSPGPAKPHVASGSQRHQSHRRSLPLSGGQLDLQLLKQSRRHEALAPFRRGDLLAAGRIGVLLPHPLALLTVEDAAAQDGGSPGRRADAERRRHTVTAWAETPHQ